MKCSRYQLAVQSLCTECKLHDTADKTRHEGRNIMDYTTQTLEQEQELAIGGDMDLDIEDTQGVADMKEQEAPGELYSDDDWSDDDYSDDDYIPDGAKEED